MATLIDTNILTELINRDKTSLEFLQIIASDPYDFCMSVTKQCVLEEYLRRNNVNVPRRCAEKDGPSKSQTT